MAQNRKGRRTAGSIRRRPSGRYQARIRTASGELQPAPDTFATKTEADRWLASAVTDQAQGRWVDAKAGKISLRRFSEEWMEGKAELAPKTIELYNYLLNRLLLPKLGDVDLADLTSARVRAWRANLPAIPAWRRERVSSVPSRSGSRRRSKSRPSLVP